MASRLTPDPTERKLWLRSELVARLIAYKWPGNVRQLKNVARQLAIASKGENEVIINAAIARLLPGSASGEEPNLGGLGTKTVPAVTQSTKRANLADISDDQLVDALRANQWKIAATARDLSISKNSLYQLMDRCALIRKAKDLTREEIQDAGATCEGNLSQMAVVLEVSRRGLQLRMTELNMP